MKKLSFLLSIIVIIFMSSCGTTYHGISGGNGCGVWYPKKFEKGNYKRMNWVNNPRSGRYRSGY